MKKFNIRALKKKELKSNKDERRNKNLLNKKKRKNNKASKILSKKLKINKSNINKKGNISRKKRMKIALIISTLIYMALIVRVSIIQFVQGENLKSMAYLQQTLDRSINPKRGTIYDATGKIVLATSSSVETITVNPLNISKENKEKVAKKLSELFSLDYESILKKLNKKTAIENIVKRVDKDKTNELRMWMSNNNISTGINIDEDTKRFYPYNNLASQVIGFCGSDNQGLAGIEAIYEETLKGKNGRILKRTDAKGIDIKNSAEVYENAVDGNDLVLSIDATVQGIAEKYLEEACIDNVCTDGGNIIVMNVKTGDILALAGYPNYNLNEPFTINTEELKDNWPNMSSSEKNNSLQAMWRNKAISDTYEPGSTFKLVTASTALEENIVTSTDNEGEFCCTRIYRSCRS